MISSKDLELLEPIRCVFMSDQGLLAAPADRLRLTCVEDAKNERRLTVRFVLGRLSEGKFQCAVRKIQGPLPGETSFTALDGGVVFNGRGYVEHGFSAGEVQEDVLLEKLANALKLKSRAVQRTA